MLGDYMVHGVKARSLAWIERLVEKDRLRKPLDVEALSDERAPRICHGL